MGLQMHATHQTLPLGFHKACCTAACQQACSSQPQLLLLLKLLSYKRCAEQAHVVTGGQNV